MPDWKNFSTVEKWSRDNAGATDCSRMCGTCQKEWKTILAEGRGDEAIHMIELPPTERTTCGLPYRFDCDQCHITNQII